MPYTGSAGLVRQARSRQTSDERKAFRKLVKANQARINEYVRTTKKSPRDIIRQMWAHILNPRVSANAAASVGYAVRRVRKFPDGNIGPLVKRILKGDEKAWNILLKIKEFDIEQASTEHRRPKEQIVEALREHIKNSGFKKLADRANIFFVIRDTFNPVTGNKRERRKK